ncbi:hypothetical protein OIU77_017960 [Salix suchowensis]|uniref:Uncharacterized protein n=1 Tax=Salix suchowensis TaxID=1278906 RepID=A0ABQ8ZR88_9ROSI|nr:hypothetical protein OIU77_017960 [Salix suchowensis]
MLPAHAAAEAVRLTITSHHFTKGEETLAAIKIQNAFRAYLGTNYKTGTQTVHMERGNGQPEESLLTKESGRQSPQIEQWPTKEAYNRQRMENLKSATTSNLFTGDIISPAQVLIENKIL